MWVGDPAQAPSPGSSTLDPYIGVWHTRLMPPVISCKHCERMTRLTEAGARSIGWRIFSGRSLTGKPLDDVVCPVCSGRGAEPQPVSWNVRCTSCGWDYVEGYGGEEPDVPVINAQDALSVLRDHHLQFVCAVADVSHFQVKLPGEPYWRRISEVIALGEY